MLGFHGKEIIDRPLGIESLVAKCLSSWAKTKPRQLREKRLLPNVDTFVKNQS
jgi:hypothetical protein